MAESRSGEKINFRYNLKEYFSFVKRHKSMLFILFLVVIVVESLFVVDKFLFKKIIDDGTLFVDGAITSTAFTQTLIIIAAIFIAVMVVRPIFKWINIHLTNVLESNLIFDLKRKYLNHILDLSHEFHSTHKTGALISRLARGSGAIEGMTDVIVYQFTPLIVQIIVVAASLAYFSLTLALVIFLITISFVVYSFIIQHIQQKSRLQYNIRRDIEKGMISDVFMNIDSIKYFGREKYIKDKYKGLAQKTKDAVVKYWGYFRWFDSGQILILGLGTFFLIYFPLMGFLNGEITLGTLVFVYAIYGNVVGPIFGFVWGLRGYYRVMADFQDLFEYGKIENEIKDKPSARNINITKGVIEFKNIGFKYKKRRMLFKNFNLKIKENEKVALVGHSGCGKTTLVKLLYRFYDVDGGQILIDGKDIRDVRQESLRGELSVVPQECILFDDTVYSNIAFSKPGARKPQIMKAMRFAQLDKIVKNFPKKERTIVGERGIKLSGGEKQRVSIARALLADKKILVLDEATSSLDSETEHEIQSSLKNLLRGRTAIMIAHRLSTIMGADRIIVMRNGRIVQEGKHRDLIQQEGEYKSLWNLQKGGYIK